MLDIRQRDRGYFWLAHSVAVCEQLKPVFLVDDHNFYRSAAFDCACYAFVDPGSTANVSVQLCDSGVFAQRSLGTAAPGPEFLEIGDDVMAAVR